MHQGPSTEVRQDYVKLMFSLNEKKADGEGFISNKEIANALHVQPPSVTGIMAKLQQSGLVEWRKRKGAMLTKQGLAFARKISEMHRLVETFITMVLKIEDVALMQRIACKMEHILLDEPRFARILEEHVNGTRQRMLLGSTESTINE